MNDSQTRIKEKSIKIITRIYEIVAYFSEINKKTKTTFNNIIIEPEK